MKHLSESEFVDLVDGTLAPGRVAHLDAATRAGRQPTASATCLHAQRT